MHTCDWFIVVLASFVIESILRYSKTFIVKNINNTQTCGHHTYTTFSLGTDTRNAIQVFKSLWVENLNQHCIIVCRYSVFGLGSSAYPNFCAFGHYLDNIFEDLGAERICKMMEGDELCGQEESFRIWAKEVFKVTIKSL